MTCLARCVRPYAVTFTYLGMRKVMLHRSINTLADPTDHETLVVLPAVELAPPMSKERLLDLVAVRVELETAAIALAAVRASDEQLARLRDMHVQAEAFLGDDFRLGPANRRLHLALVRASDNAILAMLMETLMEAFEVAEQHILSHRGEHEHDHRDHARLLQALTRRDPGTAGELMRLHLAQLYEAVARWEEELDLGW
jgi:DNA-binding FadR family transcriptional regulator